MTYPALIDHNSNPHVLPSFMSDLEPVANPHDALERMEAGLRRAEMILKDKEASVAGMDGYMTAYGDEVVPTEPPETTSDIIARLGIILVRMRYLQSVEDNHTSTVRQRHVLLVDQLLKCIDALDQ